MALDTLRANKLRSSLTILGVSVGVVTIIFMVSIIQGLNRAFADQIESLGSNTIFVSKFEPSFGRPPNPEEVHRKDLTMDDAEALRREAPSIAGVSPIHRMIAATVRYQDKQTDTPILLGVTPYYDFLHSQYVASGRFIGEIDMQDRSNVCVLGVDVIRALFPYENAVDKEIRITGTPYRVIGVMEPLGNFFGQSRDNSIFMPISTFDKYYPDQPFPQVVFFIIVRPHSRAQVKSAMDEISDILRRRRRVPPNAPNNFGISSQDSLLDVYNQLTGATAPDGSIVAQKVTTSYCPRPGARSRRSPHTASTPSVSRAYATPLADRSIPLAARPASAQALMKNPFPHPTSNSRPPPWGGSARRTSATFAGKSQRIRDSNWS